MKSTSPLEISVLELPQSSSVAVNYLLVRSMRSRPIALTGSRKVVIFLRAIRGKADLSPKTRRPTLKICSESRVNLVRHCVITPEELSKVRACEVNKPVAKDTT